MSYPGTASLGEWLPPLMITVGNLLLGVQLGVFGQAGWSSRPLSWLGASLVAAGLWLAGKAGPGWSLCTAPILFLAAFMISRMLRNAVARSGPGQRVRRKSAEGE